MSIPQAILDIAEICAQHGVRQLVMSPGSRNAPLSLALGRHPEIITRVISDERSAGYIAFGMAQSLKQPVMLLSTSGTAALNYGPAIAEAYYQQVPLLVFTADRPPEWIDQNDGQSVRQRNVFANHVKQSFELPVSLEYPDEIWQIQRTINQAIVTCNAPLPGPVHINAPFREPLYPEPDQTWEYRQNVPVVRTDDLDQSLSSDDWELLVEQWNQAQKILVAGGQHPFSNELNASLEITQEHTNIPILGDATSNLHRAKRVIKHVELILGQGDSLLQTLRPDLLITFGGGYISKNLKQFLRRFSPAQHWHIQESGYPPDTFKSLSRIVPMTPARFFSQLTAHVPAMESGDWNDTWQQHEVSAVKWMREFLKSQEFNELGVVQQVVSACQRVQLHLSNSSPVRWVDLVGASPDIIEVSSNRGTSGIDGCSSSAVGHALVEDEIHLLITGDMAFFYDRNAFWHNIKIPNLKIVLLNNHGGGIFRLIKGPSEQPELEELFVTDQTLLAENTCKDFNMKYLHCDDQKHLQTMLKELFEPNDHISVLEIEFSNNMTEIYRKLKSSLKG